VFPVRFLFPHEKKKSKIFSDRKNVPVPGDPGFFKKNPEPLENSRRYRENIAGCTPGYRVITRYPGS
jgi:hypothetical protein